MCVLTCYWEECGPGSSDQSRMNKVFMVLIHILCGCCDFSWPFRAELPGLTRGVDRGYAGLRQGPHMGPIPYASGSSHSSELPRVWCTLPFEGRIDHDQEMEQGCQGTRVGTSYLVSTTLGSLAPADLYLGWCPKGHKVVRKRDDKRLPNLLSSLPSDNKRTIWSSLPRL